MHGPGQPTLYRPEYRELARNYCRLGATNAELAAFLGVAPRTIDNWIAKVPEFAAAVRQGKAVADARVARGLFDRAVGYERTLRRTLVHRGEERTLTDTVHYPPNPQACIFWLRCRRRQDWHDGPGHSRDGPGEIEASLEAAAKHARHDPA